MMIYFVATPVRYVLVEATDEATAADRGRELLSQQYAEEGRTAPFEIHTVRPATDEEIELQRWHNEMVAREANR